MSFFRELIFKTLTRSSGWSKVRKEHIKNNPSCTVCGRDNKLEVHHIKDFSENPELELDFRNLMTLCRNCHFSFGHLFNWKSINPEVVHDSRWFLEKVKTRR